MTNTKAKSRYRFYPFLWINYVFIVLLLITNLTPFIAPDVFWPMTIMGLIFPAIVIINVLFFLFWLLLLKRYLFYSLLVLILSYSLIIDHFQFSNKSDDGGIKTKLYRVLSYNGRNLSNNNHNRGDKIIRAQIMEYAASQDADIVCFQEFQTYPTRGVNTVKDYQHCLGLNHIYKSPYLLKNSHEFLDLLVLFSKYPILNTHDFYMDGKSYGFYADIKIDGNTIRVFNLHLESNHFNRNDYQIFTESDASFDAKKRNHVIGLLQKLKKYSIKRSYQSRTIKKEIENSPFPVIIMGDFNDTPASYTVQNISRGMKDAFKEKGIGYSNTYNGDLPPMRIDYLLFDKSFSIKDYQVLEADLSDHFPIIVNFGFKE